ncbi:MAG: KamA family radical SAM protein [Methanocellales archaeon]|nr:KamA family radical SAM protein [Methanocellales archaeon]
MRKIILNQKKDCEPHSVKYTSIDEHLMNFGADIKEIERVKRKYPMKIPHYFLGLIKEKEDPIWKQCVPSIEELKDVYNIEDPLREEKHTRVSCLVHKYPDRVLLLVSSKCAMYCRFCTRKRKVGRTQQISMVEIFRAIDYIREHKEVRDVLVSGGDPLTRTDRELEIILKELRSIPHVDIIRIGTRIPCVQPSRITKRLANMLRKYHPLYINIHFNHPMEITEESKKACETLADAGIPLGSQTVLLKGVNDSVEVMKELVQKLLSIRVKPYYVYQCDPVMGVEHFRTSIDVGINIMKQLQGFTSGLCIPHFVIDGPGGKIPISPQYVKEITPEEIIVTNYLNDMYTYPNSHKVFSNELINKERLRIGLTFNLKRDPAKNERFDKYSEFDDISTIDAIRKAIESGGYEVVLLEANLDFIEKLKKTRVDFVFNIAEGINGDSRESQVPAILDMFNIPYSGSGVLTQAITLTKSMTKDILLYHNIPTPNYQLFKNTRQKLKPALKFPLIVKPNCEGSSKGINNNSLVFDDESLTKQIKYVINNYSQDALVEEYCNGREFTVSILGNVKPKVLPIVEITFDHLPENINKFDSYEVKWIYDNPKNPIDPISCPANLTPKLRKQVEKIALDAYSVLGCVDCCRIDLRLDSNGIPNVLDVNTLPGLIPDPKQNSRFPRACFAAGMTYNQMILEILHAGMIRCGLRNK